MKKDYHWYKEHKICVSCHQKEAFHKFTMCEDCLWKRQEAYHALTKEEKRKLWENSYRRVQRLVAEKRCVHCGKPAGPKSVRLCERCRIKQNQRYKDIRAKHNTKTYEEKQEAQEVRIQKAREGFHKYLQTEKGKAHMKRFIEAGKPLRDRIFKINALKKQLCQPNEQKTIK